MRREGGRPREGRFGEEEEEAEEGKGGDRSHRTGTVILGQLLRSEAEAVELRMPKIRHSLTHQFSNNEKVEHHASCDVRASQNMNDLNLGSLTPLFSYFLCAGREIKARELLPLPWININAQYSNGNTPLILAVQGEEERKNERSHQSWA